MIEVGSTYRLKDHVGYIQDLDPNREVPVEGLGNIKIEEVLNRHHPLFRGQIAEVFMVYDETYQDGKGTHIFGDVPTVEFHFEPRMLVNHEPGKHPDAVQHVHNPNNSIRRWSIPVAEVDDYFDFVAGPPAVEDDEDNVIELSPLEAAAPYSQETN